jgi:hypothetical protein
MPKTICDKRHFSPAARVRNGTKHAGGQEVMLDTQSLQLVLAVLALIALSTEVYLHNRRF